MRIAIVLIFVLLFTVNCFGYDKIVQFDDNQDIILTTVVYNSTGQICYDCSCNLKVFNNYPNENLINLSTNMKNKNNGVYSINLSRNLSYSEYIYPFTIVCNDSEGIFGGDSREGIKVSETVFDFTAGIIGIVALAVCLLYISFKMDNKFKGIKLLTFFSSFAFFLSALFVGYFVMSQAPNAQPYITIFVTTITVLLMLIMAVLYLYIKNMLEETVENSNRI